MTYETYKKYREEFLKQYKDIGEDSVGMIQLTEFKIRNFKVFIFIFSNDYRKSRFQNVVSSIRPVKYIIGRKSYANAIHIDKSDYSFIDKYPNRFQQLIDYYNKHFSTN